MVRTRPSKDSTSKSNAGRPSPYNKTIPKRAYRLSLLKLVDKELGIAFGVSEATIYNWKNEHPEFLEAINRGKLEADGKVAHSLNRAANGYFYDEVTVTEGTCTGEDCYNTYTTTKTVRKYVTPNVTAGIYLTKNRTRKNADPWNDVTRQEHTGADGGPIRIRETIDMADLTDDELEMARAIGLKSQNGKNDNINNRLFGNSN